MKLRHVIFFFAGMALAYWGADMRSMALAFFGLFVLGVGWFGPIFTDQGPKPLASASDQARAYELELVEEDEASQIRCVVVEFLHRPLTEASVELLEADIELALKRAELEFSTVLAGGREPVNLYDYVGGSPVAPAWSCKRDGHVFTDSCECVHCKVQYRQKEAGVSPMAQKVKYSALDYRSVVIVNGSHDAIATAGYDRVRSADLVVSVEGNDFRVVKDRYGPVGTIDARQLADIRTLPDVEIVQA